MTWIYVLYFQWRKPLSLANVTTYKQWKETIPIEKVNRSLALAPMHQVRTWCFGGQRCAQMPYWKLTSAASAKVFKSKRSKVGKSFWMSCFPTRKPSLYWDKILQQTVVGTTLISLEHICDQPHHLQTHSKASMTLQCAASSLILRCIEYDDAQLFLYECFLIYCFS